MKTKNQKSKTNHQSQTEMESSNALSCLASANELAADVRHLERRALRKARFCGDHLNALEELVGAEKFNRDYLPNFQDGEEKAGTYMLIAHWHYLEEGLTQNPNMSIAEAAEYLSCKGARGEILT